MSRATYIIGPELKRFWAKVDKTENCWNWRASLKDGYGVFRTAKLITVRAHKWLWEYFNGPVPEGLELDHLCVNRRCVNPSHLEPVTHRENCRRAPVGGRNWRTLKITHCPQGHEYNEANTYKYARGHVISRLCRICRTNRSNAWRQK